MHIVTFADLPWSWPELSITHSLKYFLSLAFASICEKLYPKTANFEISTARNLKILDFDLWPDHDQF